MEMKKIKLHSKKIKSLDLISETEIMHNLSFNNSASVEAIQHVYSMKCTHELSYAENKRIQSSICTQSSKANGYPREWRWESTEIEGVYNILVIWEK